jgi:D-psicose/D-tagatose/L-ribulose 3-epimerase
VTFESFSRAVVSPDLSDRLAVWRDLWTDGMDLAKQAREFIATGLAGD